MHTLVTLLGKATNNYREATYEFEGGSRRTSRFFGLELFRHVNPDKLVILGTTGSMWDNLLFETGLGERTDLEEDLLQLGEAAQQDRVSQSSLDKLAVYLAEILEKPCELRLIPYGRTQQEQTETLQILVSAFAQGDVATLDVTHGLRHLPMLVQQSALLLQTLRNVRMDGMYYGALDLTQDNITPVMRLDGLLEIDRWSEALSHYDRTGDYAIFAPLLETSGFSRKAIDSLRDAAFYEQTNSIHKAWTNLRRFLSMLEKEEEQCSSHARLFIDALKQRFTWVKEKQTSIRQAEVAWLALDNGNLLRATLYGFEAFVTQLTEQAGVDLDDHIQRNRAKDDYECHNGQEKKYRDCANNTPSAEWQDYVLLRSIRNQLAHSSSHSHPDTQRAVATRTDLSRTLRSIFKSLIPIKKP